MQVVTTYILTFPNDVQEKLSKIRAIIQKIAPDAVESFSYGMPAYKLNKKPLVYFAGYKYHIGLYATPSGQAHFKQELAGYKQGKGSVQFPLTEEPPYGLIEQIITYKKDEILNTKA
ncbi:MAG: DUF1801 domain-containing protein [Crocinitomicaceae bacterium]|nr:DUF1801 domain-containing protein [Crocinitomicaceae bacterium]